MIIKFTFDNIPLSVPQSWCDISNRQWSLLKNPKNTTEDCIAVLLNISIEQVKHWGADFLIQVMQYLKWTNETFDISTWLVPDIFMGVDVPKDLKRLSFGQKILFHNLMTEEYKKSKDLNNVINKCIAIYMQPLVQRVEFDYDKAMEFSSEVGDQKFCEVYPVGCFFLTKCMR